MTDITKIDGQFFVRLIAGGAANLRANVSIVNDLNVFPIPDGDTGENMSRTIGGGVERLSGFKGDSVGAAAELLADGMLLNARGNSGVILSQLFAGIAEGLKGKETAGAAELSAALQAGVKSAYAAVLNPTEGTILTVAREAAEYAGGRLVPESTVASFGRDYLEELRASLDRTPGKLAVLKEAGVVDSGGAGLYYIAEGIGKALRGEELPEWEAFSQSGGAEAPDFSKFNESSVMEYGYCTEFLLQLQSAKTDIGLFSEESLKDYLQSVGDSVVSFRTGSVVKCHVHTMTPGRVLEHCQQYGEFLTLKIENMSLQHSTSKVENRFAPAKKRRKYGVVAVASGEGIRETFLSLGADAVIDGGQSMNPSAGEFTEAFDAVNAETLLVFPNNSNIILTAKQAAKLYSGSDVRVVESRTLGEGYAALTMLDVNLPDTDAVVAQLYEAMENVVTGHVSQAVRDATVSGASVHKGLYIGYTGKKILSEAPTAPQAVEALLEGLKAEERDVIIVVSGEEAAAEDCSALYERLRLRYKRSDVFVIDGGQEIYDYILILE